MRRRGKSDDDKELLGQIEQMMLSGFPTKQIEASLAKTSGKSPRTIRRFLAEVKSKWGGDPQRGMWLHTYRKAMAKGNYGAAVKALARLETGTDEKLEPSGYKKQLGPIPDDPLKAVEYAQRANLLALEEVFEDSTLSLKERREEIRRLSRVIQSLVPDVRRYEAEKAVREDDDTLQDLNDERVEMEDVSEVGSRPLRAEDPGARPHSKRAVRDAQD